MATASSLQQFQLPTIYPTTDHYTKTNIYPETMSIQHQLNHYQYEKDVPPDNLHQQYPTYHYAMQGYQIGPQQHHLAAAWSHNYTGAVHGIVPEPERFGDLCEKGLVPIVIAANLEIERHKVTSSPGKVMDVKPPLIKCETSASISCSGNIATSAVALANSSSSSAISTSVKCEPTYVTTSQPLMCHGSVGGVNHPTSTSLEYNYVSADQIDPMYGTWSSDIDQLSVDPFYPSYNSYRPFGSDHMGASSSGSIPPSPWDFYRTSSS